MCFYVNGPYITISATKISKGFVAVDGKSGDCLLYTSDAADD